MAYLNLKILIFLNLRMSEATMEKQSLMACNRSLNEELIATKNQLKELVSTIQVEKENMEDYRVQIEHLQKEKSILNSNLSNTKKSLEESNQVVYNQQEQIDELLKREKSMLQLKTQAHTNLQELKDELECLSKQAMEDGVLKATLHQKEMLITSLKEEINALQSNKLSYISNINDMEHSINERTAKIKQALSYVKMASEDKLPTIAEKILQTMRRDVKDPQLSKSLAQSISHV